MSNSEGEPEEPQEDPETVRKVNALVVKLRPLADAGTIPDIDTLALEFDLDPERVKTAVLYAIKMAEMRRRGLAR